MQGVGLRVLVVTRPRRQRMKGLGRMTKSYSGYDTSETSYADAGTVSGDTILGQNEMTYDAAGNVTLMTMRQRLHDANRTTDATPPRARSPSRSSTTTATRC